MNDHLPHIGGENSPLGQWVVIGGSGFVGTHIVDALRRRGADVISVSAPRLQFNGPRTPGAVMNTLSTCDTEVDTLSTQLVRSSVVINAAGMAQPDSPDTDELFGANALLPVVIAAAVRKAGNGLLLHLSSAAVQGDADELDDRPHWAPFSPYSRSKMLSEQCLLGMADEHGDITVIRATSVQGPNRRTTRSLQRLAQSRLSSVASPGTQPSPVSSVRGLSDFVVAVGCGDETRSVLLLQPWEGGTVSSVLTSAGNGRTPMNLPRSLCRLVIGSATAVSKLLGGRFAGLIRRVELTWFGQPQCHSIPAIQPTNLTSLDVTLKPAPGEPAG